MVHCIRKIAYHSVDFITTININSSSETLIKNVWHLSETHFAAVLKCVLFLMRRIGLFAVSRKFIEFFFKCQRSKNKNLKSLLSKTL